MPTGYGLVINQICNQYDVKVKKLKKSFYYKMFEECIGDSRRAFRLLNDLKGKNTSRSSFRKLTSCVTNEHPAPTDHQIAEAFNDFFANIGKKIQETTLSVPLTLPKKLNFSLFLYPVTEIEVSNIISSLDNKHSSGIDNISNVLFRRCFPQ